MTGQSPHSEPVSELRPRPRVPGPGHCPLPPQPHLLAGLMGRAGTRAQLLMASLVLACEGYAAPTALVDCPGFCRLSLLAWAAGTGIWLA